MTEPDNAMPIYMRLLLACSTLEARPTGSEEPISLTLHEAKELLRAIDLARAVKAASHD